jgi:hypothetical protein
MTLADLRRPSVIWRLALGYLAAVFAYVVFIDVAASLHPIRDGCAGWSRMAECWRPLSSYVGGYIVVMLLSAVLFSLVPVMMLVLVFARIRMRALSAFLSPPVALFSWLLLNSPLSLEPLWVITMTFVALALFVPCLIFYFFGWLPAWLAADAARNQLP